MPAYGAGATWGAEAVPSSAAGVVRRAPEGEEEGEARSLERLGLGSTEATRRADTGVPDGHRGPRNQLPGNVCHRYSSYSVSMPQHYPCSLALARPGQPSRAPEFSTRRSETESPVVITGRLQNELCRSSLPRDAWKKLKVWWLSPTHGRPCP